MIEATAVSIVPCPLIITTGSSGYSRLITSSTWMPSMRLPCSQISSTTRCGLRARTAAQAPSPSAATRVSKPSSRRMPAIRSRMSSSSSTIRISGAASNPFLLIPYTILVDFTHALLTRGKHEAHFRATLVPGNVGQRNLAAVILDNLAHDGEAEAGALGPRRHIGLGEPMTLIVRQADSVIADAEYDLLADGFDFYVDSSRPVVAFRLARTDCLGRVLEHICQRLGDEPSVAFQPHRRLRRLDGKRDGRMRHALQEHRLVEQLLRILPLHHRHRHAGEGGELVHHAADIADLTDDRIGALLEHLAVGLHLAAIFPLQPLCGELDGRQRGLDLVGDAAGDIRPSRGPLRRDQIGDVVKGHDVSGLRGARFAGDLHAQRAHLAGALHRRLPARAAYRFPGGRPNETRTIGRA